MNVYAMSEQCKNKQKRFILFLSVESLPCLVGTAYGRKMPCLWIIIIWINAFYVLRMPNNNEYEEFIFFEEFICMEF